MNGYKDFADNSHLSLVCGTYVDRELDMGANFWDFLREKQRSIWKTSFIPMPIAHIEEDLPILPGFATSEDANLTISHSNHHLSLSSSQLTDLLQ